MCQTNLISQNIERLSVRSYKQRLRVSIPEDFHLSSLVRLNKSLNDFYDLLYSQLNTITEDDYRVFGGKFQIMLDTIKDMIETFERLSKTLDFKDEINVLKMNYSALFELNSDIVNFKIKMPKDSDMDSLLERASKVSKSMSI